MYNFIKYTIIAVALLFALLMAVALSGHVAPKVELIQKPEYASVIIDDERSMCEKRSEMNLIRDWEKACKRNGEDRNCSLPKKTVTPLFEYKAWYVNNCR